MRLMFRSKVFSGPSACLPKKGVASSEARELVLQICARNCAKNSMRDCGAMPLVSAIVSEARAKR